MPRKKATNYEIDTVENRVKVEYLTQSVDEVNKKLSMLFKKVDSPAFLPYFEKRLENLEKENQARKEEITQNKLDIAKFSVLSGLAGGVIIAIIKDFLSL